MKHPAWRFVILAVLIFVGLNQGYLRASPGIKNLLARRMNAAVAGSIIQALTPSEQVQVEGGRVVGVRGAVDVRNGCEGFEVMLILAAITLAYPLRWWLKIAGVVIGSLVLYTVNLVRIISLYYIAATHPAWFDPAHILIWQTLMILLTVGLFLACIKLDQRLRAS